MTYTVTYGEDGGATCGCKKGGFSQKKGGFSQDFLKTWNLEQVSSIRRIPPSDDEDKVDAFEALRGRELGDGVLPHLCRVTDRVERRKVRGHILGAVGLDDRLLEQTADCLRFVTMGSMFR